MVACIGGKQIEIRLQKLYVSAMLVLLSTIIVGLKDCWGYDGRHWNSISTIIPIHTLVTARVVMSIAVPIHTLPTARPVATRRIKCYMIIILSPSMIITAWTATAIMPTSTDKLVVRIRSGVFQWWVNNYICQLKLVSQSCNLYCSKKMPTISLDKTSN